MAPKKSSKSASKQAGGELGPAPTKLTAAQKADKEKQDAAPVVAGISQTHKVRPDQPAGTQQVLAPTAAPNPQMVLVREKATGRVFAAWPVDARELVTHPQQEHEYASEEHAADWAPPSQQTGLPMPAVAPTSPNSPIGVDPVNPPQVPVASRILSNDQAKEALNDKSKSELQDLAVRVGVDKDQSKADLVKALEPHATAGTLNLTPPASLQGKAPSTSTKIGE